MLSVTGAFYEQTTAKLRLALLVWQGLLSLNGTLEEWIKKPGAEFAAIESDIREIRELLDED